MCSDIPMDAANPRRVQFGEPGAARRFMCWLCEATLDLEALPTSGWMLEADDTVAACPKHAYRTPADPRV
jgi:hypothetical protein